MDFRFLNIIRVVSLLVVHNDHSNSNTHPNWNLCIFKTVDVPMVGHSEICLNCDHMKSGMYAKQYIF